MAVKSAPPTLDQLANNGLRFSSFYTTASCAPTRAMLLTGVDSHRAGVANISEALTPEQAPLAVLSRHPQSQCHHDREALE